MGIKLTFSVSPALTEVEEPDVDLSKQPEEITLGPFEFVQLTYEGLRVGPNGEHIAFLKDGLWHLGVEHTPIGNGWESFGPASDAALFSDVSMYEEEAA
jgi:hypothetical protein